MIEAQGVFKYSEVDDFEQGCIGPSTDYVIDQVFSGDTVDEVIQKVCDMIGIPTKDRSCSIERNSCDELGRVDIACTEDDDGTILTPAQVEQWKAGKLRAWYAVYTIYLHQVTRERIAA